MVASVIVAGALALVMESISAGLAAAGRNEQEMFAYRLAADRLDRALAESAVAGARSGEVSHQGVTYAWEVRPLGPDARGLRRVRCTVRWTRRHRRRSLQLERRILSAHVGGPGP